MSIISSFLNFFVPPRRRKPPVVPTGGAVEPLAPGAERAFGRGLDEALAAVNAPAQVGDFIKADLDAALSPTGRMPAYYPGAPTRLTISPLGLFTDPWEEVKKVYTENFATKWTDLFYTPEDLVGAVNKAVWGYLADQVWVSAGRSVIPLSLREVLSRYGARAPIGRPLQIAARGLVTRNPGMTLMLAHRLNLHYSAVPGATYDAAILGKISTFQSISTEAQGYESGIAAAVAREDWAEADRLQEEWAERNRDLIREASAEFKSLASQPGSPLYNSAEAQFLRYFQLRDQFFGTLNFLKTFKKNGFWGVMKQYAWRDLVLGEEFSGFGIAIKGLNIRGKILNKLEKAVRKSPFGKLASKLVSFREAGKRLRKKFTKAVMQKGLEKLGLKQLVAFLGKLVAKLIGTLGNTVAPWVAVAAGVILSFFTDLIVDAVGGLLKALGYLTGGLISCLILFGIGIIVLISIILGNIKYPWEMGGLTIDCDQSATATDSCVAPKSEVKRIADNWGEGPGNYVEECYSDVIAKSRAAGVDPRVVMATWLNESNASNYEMYERLGEPPQDFGIPSQAGNGFTVQITSFLNFYKQSPSTYPACYQGYGVVEGFFRTFCTAGRADLGVGTCPNLTPTGQDCVVNYLGVYDMTSICFGP